jgi:hypothetical protein
MTLGLHVRSEAKDLPDMDKELRVRVWWSLYALERLLDELTGRPSGVSDRDISTPLPINVDEADFSRDRKLYEKSGSLSKDKTKSQEPQLPTPADSSCTSNPSKISSSTGSPPSSGFLFPMTRLPLTSSTYFIYRTQLSIIAHDILTQLYCASLVKHKWVEVQDTIRQIDDALQKWQRSLPEEYDFTTPSTPYNSQFGLHRASLAMFYNSARMTIFRPCVCRFENRIENQSERSKQFDVEAAITCVQSARNVIAALPSLDEPTRVYYISAWWNAVHYIIEAISILMLELAYRSEHLPSEAEQILADSKTAVMWLRAMADQSIAARRGWEIFDDLIRRVAPKIGGTTWEMPNTAPIPPGYKSKEPSSNRSGDHRDNFVPHSQAFNDHANMSEWVNQATNAGQQGYTGPVTMGMTAVTTGGGLIPSYLAPFYPFNELYGRFDETQSWQNSYFQPNMYPATTAVLTGNIGSLTSQMGAMGQVQQYDGLANYGEGRYVSSGTGNHDYGIANYQDWTAANSGGNQGDRYTKDPGQE